MEKRAVYTAPQSKFLLVSVQLVYPAATAAALPQARGTDGRDAGRAGRLHCGHAHGAQVPGRHGRIPGWFVLAMIDGSSQHIAQV